MDADKFSLSPYADFIPKSGRALMAPIYKSTFERRDELKSDYPEPTALWRDHMIDWSKDLGRSLDYLETRKDIDHGKLAYLGLSWGERGRADPPRGRGSLQGRRSWSREASSSRGPSRRPTRSTS